MTRSVFIDGAVGTTGLEIRERLAGRSEFSLIILDEDKRKDEAARAEALNDCDIAILCLPDDAARDAAALVRSERTRIIDASSAHRVADGWTYGFPEIIGRDAIASAMRISNPGCYPTGFLALITPLVRAGILPADWPYTINAVSGYSGGGKALIERFEAEQDIAWRGYSFALDHKHLPEMQKYAALKHPVIFAPSVIPAYRGMVVEIPLHLGAMGGDVTPDRLRGTLHEFYAASNVVNVRDSNDMGEMLLSKNSAPFDGINLHVFGNAGGYHARLIAQLDNLGKGASGAAVQNLNILAGLPEETGLSLSA